MDINRINQIVRYGCQSCGGVLSLVASDFSGFGYKCENSDCALCGKFIPEEKAEAEVPKSEKLIKAKESMRVLQREVREAKKKVEELAVTIHNTKLYINRAQWRMKEYGKAYKKVANLRLFEQGKRVFDKSNPFKVAYPLKEEWIEITSINSKRRAKVMLSALFWIEKSKYNKAVQDLLRLRAELRKAKSFLKENKWKVA